MTHGLLSTHISPALSKTKMDMVLTKAMHSSKKSVWLLFSKITSGAKEEQELLQPGSFCFSAVPERDAAISPGKWWFPGRDGIFIGSRDELVAILSNSGRNIALFDAAKLAQHGIQSMLYIATSKDGEIKRLFKGPPCRIPGAPKPRPVITAEEENDETDEEEEAAMQEWEAHEVRRMEMPKQILAFTKSNRCDPIV